MFFGSPKLIPHIFADWQASRLAAGSAARFDEFDESDQESDDDDAESHASEAEATSTGEDAQQPSSSAVPPNLPAHDQNPGDENSSMSGPVADAALQPTQDSVLRRGLS